MTPDEIIETIERLVWLADNGERPSRGELGDAEAAIAAVRNTEKIVHQIADLDPARDSNHGAHDEWGESECFVIARDLARTLL